MAAKAIRGRLLMSQRGVLRRMLALTSAMLFNAPIAYADGLYEAYNQLLKRRLDQIEFYCGDEFYKLSKRSLFGRSPSLSRKSDLAWEPVEGVQFEDSGIRNLANRTVFEVAEPEAHRDDAPETRQATAPHYIDSTIIGILGQRLERRPVAFTPTPQRIQGPSVSHLDLLQGVMISDNLFTHRVTLVPRPAPFLTPVKSCFEPLLPEDPETLRTVFQRDTPDYSTYMSCVREAVGELGDLGLDVAIMAETLDSTESSIQKCETDYQTRRSIEQNEQPKIVGQLMPGVPLFEIDKPDRAYGAYKACTSRALRKLGDWNSELEEQIRSFNREVFQLVEANQPHLTILPHSLQTTERCFLVRSEN